MTLRADELTKFAEDGYLHVPQVVPPHLLDSLEAEFDEVLDRLIDRLSAEEERRRIRSEDGFANRLIAFAATGCPFMQSFEIGFPFANLTPETPAHFGDAVFDLLTCEEILNIVEDLIGPEISINPVHHTRLKLPASQSEAIARNGGFTAKTGWHQDLSAVLADADRTEEVAVWVAMTDAGTENGCLEYLPGSHREGLALHCGRNSPRGRHSGSHIPIEYIDEPRSVPVPVKRGDILVHTMLTKHASLENTSSEVRWSFDLRYQRTGQPTGRPIFPAYVARSEANPDSVCRDPQVWRQGWLKSRDLLLDCEEEITFNRWTVESAFC